MQADFNLVTSFDPESDFDLDACLSEYLSTLGPSEARALAGRVKISPAFDSRLRGAIVDMSMLFAAASVLDDESSFEEIAQQVIHNSAADCVDVRRLRRHYLQNSRCVDMAGTLGVDLETCLERLAACCERLPVR
jgi:hypothetical protein